MQRVFSSHIWYFNDSYVFTYIYILEILRENIYSVKIQGSTSDIKFCLQIVQLFPFFEIIVSNNC